MTIVNHSQSRIRSLNDRSYYRTDCYTIIYYLYSAITNSKFSDTVGEDFYELTSGVYVKSKVLEEQAGEIRYLSTFNYVKVNREIFCDLDFSYNNASDNIIINSYYFYFNKGDLNVL